MSTHASHLDDRIKEAGFIQLTGAETGNSFLLRPSTIMHMQGAPDGEQKALVWTTTDPGEALRVKESVDQIVACILETM